jgi:hypothetical protein
MIEPTDELQLRAADERRALESSVRELRRRVFSLKNELALLCGVLVLVSVAGYLIFKLAERRSFVDGLASGGEQDGDE